MKAIIYFSYFDANRAYKELRLKYNTPNDARLNFKREFENLQSAGATRINHKIYEVTDRIWQQY